MEAIAKSHTTIQPMSFTTKQAEERLKNYLLNSLTEKQKDDFIKYFSTNQQERNNNTSLERLDEKAQINIYFKLG